MRPHALLLFLPCALAFQLPFHVPFFKKSVPESEVAQPPPSTIPRIAIIGAGAAGSSAAFWISKAKERYGLKVEVDVYEKEGYVGGRSTVVYPHGNTSLPPLELGASIFVEVNKNLWRASDEFNLTRVSPGDDSDAGTGIWDGQTLRVSFRNSWWDSIKLVWRYGMLSPMRADRVVKAMIQKFVTLYASATPKWDSISDLSTTLEWNEHVQNTTTDYFMRKGVLKDYAYEVIEAATRVNYGQNADRIHALEGACSLAATGATAIQGGNFKIFEQFVKRSGANILLNTSVSSIKHSPSSHQWTVRRTRGSTDYRAVIIAAPFHSTGVALPTSLTSLVPPQPYVHLHVTLLATTMQRPDPAYFGLTKSSDVPGMMLTTYEGVREGGKEPEFNSLSYHGAIREGEWAVKIFSKQPLSDEWLNKLFLGNVTWVLRKEWAAYPELPPTTTFPPVRLEQGLYYVNAFEPFISTMETETIASRNVVDLLLNEEFGSGICGARISAAGSTNATTNSTTATSDGAQNTDGKDFVYGWDC